MAIVIELKVTPSSGKNGWALDTSGIIKCYLKSPAQQGKANEELIKVLAKALGLTMSAITIVRGNQSRKKAVKIEAALTQDAILALLGLEKKKQCNEQMNVFN